MLMLAIDSSWLYSAPVAYCSVFRETDNTNVIYKRFSKGLRRTLIVVGQETFRTVHGARRRRTGRGVFKVTSVWCRL